MRTMAQIGASVPCWLFPACTAARLDAPAIATPYAVCAPSGLPLALPAPLRPSSLAAQAVASEPRGQSWTSLPPLLVAGRGNAA